MTQEAVTQGRPDDLVAGLEADLAALAAADADLERDAEAAERTRIERAAIGLADRLRGALGPVEVSVPGGRYAGLVTEVGTGWVLIAGTQDAHRPGTTEHLVALRPVLTVRGLGRAVPAGPRAPRPVTSVLRGWSRDRSQVSVLLVDGAVVRGRASATYADHLEVAAAGGPLAVPLSAVAVLSRWTSVG